jgi:hypothetical protein
LDFPTFHPTAYERRWVISELTTSQVIRALWNGASRSTRQEPEFLGVLARCSWINDSEGDGESTRRWRNRHIGHWLGAPTDADEGSLARVLASKLNLSLSRARWLIRTQSGITQYYTSLRPRTFKAIQRHASDIYRAFDEIAQRSSDPIEKVGRTAAILAGLPGVHAPSGGTVSLLNGLTPAAACLDPQRRFPIMNDRTRKLLAALGKRNDAAGACALARLIGQYGIKHAFDLDVYASSDTRTFPPARRARRAVVPRRLVGWKDEETGYAQLQRRRVRVRKLHNTLINKFVTAVEWRYQLREGEFDVVIEDWRKGRKLLVEAKTETTGPAGRTQLRQAIGQLFDYRWRWFAKDPDTIDLALLLPRKPEKDVLALLTSLGIKAFWFEGKALAATTTF